MNSKEQYPDDWKHHNLNTIGKIITGSTPPTSNPDYYGDDYFFISPADLGEIKYINNSVKKISKLGLQVSRSIPKNSIMVACIGSTIGKVGISSELSTTNQQINSIIPNNNIESEYVYYYLTYVSKYLKKHANLSPIPIINKTDFGKIRIPVPPLVEQRGIVEVLGTVDECIRLTDAVIERAEELKRGLMQQLLTRGIGHTEYKETPLGKIPKTWIICKIDALLNENKNALKTGPFGSSLKKESYVENGYKIYGQEQVIPNNFTIGDYYISEEKFYELKDYEIKQNDVLISLVGTYGRVSVVPSNIERGIINPRLLKITPKQSKINSHYLKLLLISEIIKKQLLKYSHGATMGIINTKIIKSLTFPIPPLDEQNKILEIITRINKKLACEEDSRDNLNILRKGLMQLLLSGKIRVELKGDGVHRIGDGRESNN